jgi:Uma2 family endonuclease
VATLLILLRQFVERYGLGVVLPDVDLLFVSGQFLRPDLVFVPNEARDGITDRGVEKAPGLVVEILSPTSSAIDRVKKPRRYGDFGVPEYWVVDPEEKVVWWWAFTAGKHDAERVSERITWSPLGAPGALEIELSALFQPY